MKKNKHIAILGGGPSGLFMFKRCIESKDTGLSIDIFEKNKTLGAGMPYSKDGSNREHITNVSGNEIPELVSSVEEWIQTVPQRILDFFHVDRKKYNDFKVFPRLLFGLYLSDQFELLKKQAEGMGIQVRIHLNTTVTNITDKPADKKVAIESNEEEFGIYDHVIVCTGHRWPRTHEGKIAGYFDSPYPPSKLKIKIDHPVAVRGSSLTAIDAIRTLSRENGHYEKDEHGWLKYHVESKGFKLTMHSRQGLLPAVRFHLEDPHLLKDAVLSDEEVQKNRDQNGGFLSLDYVFEQNFKRLIQKKEPGLYEQIKDMKMEEFVGKMMDLRENVAPFDLLHAEYLEAQKSIKRHKSVYWKEMLAVLSFAMNYPAKYFSAEDMLRLQKVLMPLISIVIAFVPQSSVEELLALHRAGILDIVAVGDDSTIETHPDGGIFYHYKDESGMEQKVYYKTFVDSIGQAHLHFEDFPYMDLIRNKDIAPARLRFKDQKEGLKAFHQSSSSVEKDAAGQYMLKVPGIQINDHFQIIHPQGKPNDRIYVMATPYIGGYNPDYSGLDFCEAASAKISEVLFKN